jgi:hypothetical protein
MKCKLQVLASASASALLALSALAREPLDPQPDETNPNRQPISLGCSEQLDSAVRATDNKAADRPAHPAKPALTPIPL